MQKISKHHTAAASAYQSIHYFFDLYHLNSALECLNDLIEAAADTKIWRVMLPATGCFIPSS